MLFINTRPQDRAAVLTETLQQAGVRVLELPLLELKAAPWSQDLAQLYSALLYAQVIVVVSPSAVHMGMAGLAQAGLKIEQLKQIHWIAVGQVTANTLADYGINSAVPEVETSEGMLSLPILEQLAAGATVAFWRGEGGRQFMMQQLIDRGIHVLNFVLYHRQCPTEAEQIIKKNRTVFESSSSYCMLVTSEASWLNWLRLMQPYPQCVADAYYLVLGERLMQLLEHYGQQSNLELKILQLNDLNALHILQQVRQVQGNT